MRNAIIVLNVFAAVWGAAAILGAHLPVWLIAAPILVSGAMLAWSGRALRNVAPRPDAARVGRLIGIWSAVEGIAIFATVTALQNLDMVDAIGPAIAIVVGLHFVPLARGIPGPLYYATAAAMVVAGAAALLLPGPERLPAAGLASALILWASGATLLLRGDGAPRPAC